MFFYAWAFGTRSGKTLRKLKPKTTQYRNQKPNQTETKNRPRLKPNLVPQEPKFWSARNTILTPGQPLRNAILHWFYKGIWQSRPNLLNMRGPKNWNLPEPKFEHGATKIWFHIGTKNESVLKQKTNSNRNKKRPWIGPKNGPWVRVPKARL